MNNKLQFLDVQRKFNISNFNPDINVGTKTDATSYYCTGFHPGLSENGSTRLLSGPTTHQYMNHIHISEV